MKKLNKKGFTLIELLVVLVILAIIMSIAIPSITSTIERNKDKQRKNLQDLAISAGELYFDNHKNSAIPSEGVYVSTLISNKLLVGVELSKICDHEDCCIIYAPGAEKIILEDDQTNQCQAAH